MSLHLLAGRVTIAGKQMLQHSQEDSQRVSHTAEVVELEYIPGI